MVRPLFKFRRDLILEVLTSACITHTGKKSLAFFYKVLGLNELIFIFDLSFLSASKDDLSLINYTTTKFEAKKGISRIPKDSPIVSLISSLFFIITKILFINS